jgi:hypothetical protein
VEATPAAPPTPTGEDGDASFFDNLTATPTKLAPEDPKGAKKDKKDAQAKEVRATRDSDPRAGSSVCFQQRRVESSRASPPHRPREDWVSPHPSDPSSIQSCGRLGSAFEAPAFHPSREPCAGCSGHQMHHTVSDNNS